MTSNCHSSQSNEIYDSDSKKEEEDNNINNIHLGKKRNNKFSKKSKKLSKINHKKNRYQSKNK